MGLGAQLKWEHFTIYSIIYVLKQYFQLLNWHKIVTLHYNIDIFSWKLLILS